MPINNRAVADGGPLSEADKIWYRIVRQVASMRRALSLDQDQEERKDTYKHAYNAKPMEKPQLYQRQES